jgi:uncharacterized protein (UPF0305 family)
MKTYKETLRKVEKELVATEKKLKLINQKLEVLETIKLNKVLQEMPKYLKRRYDVHQIEDFKIISADLIARINKLNNTKEIMTEFNNKS